MKYELIILDDNLDENFQRLSLNGFLYSPKFDSMDVDKLLKIKVLKRISPNIYQKISNIIDKEHINYKIGDYNLIIYDNKKYSNNSYCFLSVSISSMEKTG
jgi:hypothetical protein